MKKTEAENKNILFINSGGPKKAFTLERAKKKNMNVILVNSKLDTNKNLIKYFIEADTYNHDEVIEKIHLFLKKNPHIKLDGAITFWEDDVPLLARVCEEFKLTGNSHETAIKTRDKFEMRKRLKETGLGNPSFHLVKTQKNLKEAIKEIGFPAVMKPVWGADSEFVILVQNEEEAKNTLDYLIKNCTEQFNPIFKYNNSSFLFEQYMEGTEVSIEAYSRHGIPYVIGIHEKQPIKPPYFIEYGDIAPARLDKSIEAQVIKLAESALIALGVQNSLSHIEIKITKEGPKIVEAASRMGGDDIYFNVKHIWNIDMVDLGLQIALNQGIKKEIKEAKEKVICRYFIPESSGVVTKIENIKEIQKFKNVLKVSITKNVGDSILVPPVGFENAGWAITKGKTYQEAETEMNRLTEKLKINITRFHKDSSLGKTSRKNSLQSAASVRSLIMQASRFEKIKSININNVKKLNIGILTNSKELGNDIKSTLNENGYNTHLLTLNDVPTLVKNIQKTNTEFIINLAEYAYESALLKPQIAGLLDILQIPYTGSNPSTLALARDKINVKKLLDYHEIPTPNWDYIEDIDDEISPKLKYPLIVKPANSDNYFGISNESVVCNLKELKKQAEIILQELKRPVLIEEYIEGDEIDVCIIGNQEEAETLPLIRSIFDKMPKNHWHIYSSEIYKPENEEILKSIKVEKPAKVSAKMETLISEIALDMYNIFDCQDYAKIELRLDKEGNPYVLEINPNPPISKTDFLPITAKLADYKYSEFLEEIISIAIKRHKNHSPFSHLRQSHE